jgi:hypothetical protein
MPSLEQALFQYGLKVATYPKSFIAGAVILIAALSSGMTKLHVEQNPQAIWVPPGSPTALQQAYFGDSFDPFFRIEQAIFSMKPAALADYTVTEPSAVQQSLVDSYGNIQGQSSNGSLTCQRGNLLTISGMHDMLTLQNAITFTPDSAGEFHFWLNALQLSFIMREFQELCWTTFATSPYQGKGV